jgi:putative redox protein
VEDYLTKRRTPAESLVVTVTAVRRGEVPRRIMSAHLAFAIMGAGIEPPHAVRAVALAVERYCSVGASLAADLVVTRAVSVNGEPASAQAGDDA